jgi:hypothetical protein
MTRTVLSVVAGYAVIAALVFMAETMAQVFGGSRQTLAFVNLLIAFPCGSIGGYATAFIARRHAVPATLALTAVALGMGVVSLWLSHGRQPVWYSIGLLGLLPGGALYGGVRGKQQNSIARSPKLVK